MEIRQMLQEDDIFIGTSTYGKSRFSDFDGFVCSNHYLEDNFGGKRLREVQYCYCIASEKVL